MNIAELEALIEKKDRRNDWLLATWFVLAILFFIAATLKWVPMRAVLVATVIGAVLLYLDGKKVWALRGQLDTLLTRQRRQENMQRQRQRLAWEKTVWTKRNFLDGVEKIFFGEGRQGYAKALVIEFGLGPYTEGHLTRGVNAARVPEDHRSFSLGFACVLLDGDLERNGYNIVWSERVRERLVALHPMPNDFKPAEEFATPTLVQPTLQPES